MTVTALECQASWPLKALLLLGLLITLPACSLLKLKKPRAELVVTKTVTQKIAPQLSQKPQEINIPAFDGFEVITQGDDGLILGLMRKVLPLIVDDDTLKVELEVLIDKFERGQLTLAVRACDTKKPNCKKLKDGSLTFPSPLNHMALHSDDYLQMSKAWSDIIRYINGAERKFKEDQRRIDEAMKDENNGNL